MAHGSASTRRDGSASRAAPAREVPIPDDPIPAPVPPAAAAPRAPPWLPWRIALTNLTLLPLLAVGIGVATLSPTVGLSDLFLMTQDAAVVGVGAVALLALACVRRRAAPQATARVVGRDVAIGLAILVAVVGYAGAKLVFQGTTVSADETMARFDARAFAHGRLLTPVPPDWRPFEIGLAPSFLLAVKGWTHWGSNYLPVSAAIQALFLRLGDADLASPLLAAVAALATFGVGRRVWPERPERAWLAAALLASSPQFLVTAMTPYAMTAHLAFDMAWLWLLLGRSWRSQVAAGAVAFGACGLHQLVFHPLFAAPFVLHLWLSRQWGRAAFHTAVYALAGAFWTAWFPLAAHLAGAELAPHRGTAVDTLTKLLRHFDPGGAGMMVENLLRFAAWQNPLVWPLWILGALATWRLRGIERAMAAGPLLTLAAVWVLVPYQGHGWGYRYLHGFLGTMALVAALGFTDLLDRRDAKGSGAEGRAALGRGAAAVMAATLLALVPLRIGQAWAWTAPEAGALRLMRASGADTVLIDSTGLFYAWDLARNDPALTNRPKLLASEPLDGDDLAALCDAGRVATFDRTAALALGMRPALMPPAPARLRWSRQRRAFLDARGCAPVLRAP